MRRVDRIIGVLALAAVLAAGAGCGSKGNGPVQNANRFTALGEVMAVKTAEVCGGQGDLVLLVSDQDTANTAFGMAADAFRRALNPAMHIATVEKLTLPPLMPGGEPLAPDAFLKLLAKHSRAAGLVSFVGVPPLSAEQLAQLPVPRPKVIEVVAFNPPTREMFAQQVVCLAALTQPANDTGARPQSAQEWFDACYQLVTPESAGKLP